MLFIKQFRSKQIRKQLRQLLRQTICHMQDRSVRWRLEQYGHCALPASAGVRCRCRSSGHAAAAARLCAARGVDQPCPCRRHRGCGLGRRAARQRRRRLGGSLSGLRQPRPVEVSQVRPHARTAVATDVRCLLYALCFTMPTLHRTQALLPVLAAGWQTQRQAKQMAASRLSWQRRRHAATPACPTCLTPQRSQQSRRRVGEPLIRALRQS